MFIFQNVFLEPHLVAVLIREWSLTSSNQGNALSV